MNFSLRYFFCDLLNLVNVFGQMYFVNMFLGGVFMTYGTDVLNFMNQEDEDRSDPMMEVFPRVTKCTFHKYGASGTIMKLDALCVLGLNIINEKIYITLWFWFVFLALATSLYTVYIVAIISMPGGLNINNSTSLSGSLINFTNILCFQYQLKHSR